MRIFKGAAFKISFIATLSFFLMAYLFLIVDNNTKNTALKNSPAILKIQNVDRKYYHIEFMGKNYKMEPVTINIDKKYKPIIRALIPKKIRLMESMVYYVCSLYKEVDECKRNLDYLNNINN